VSVSVKHRTQPCELAHAKIRLEHARSFITVAELIGTEEDDELASRQRTPCAAGNYGCDHADKTTGKPVNFWPPSSLTVR
jgi:hypothetical protein